MCSNWLVDGRRCDHGQDLIDALGEDKARIVNTMYEIVSENITDANVAEACLCHVDPDLMQKITGRVWEYDCDEDAFVAEPLPR